jgi:hypothetical protein
MPGAVAAIAEAMLEQYGYSAMTTGRVKERKHVQ